MQKIWKYTVPFGDRTEIDLAYDARFRAFRPDSAASSMELWFQVDPAHPVQARTFFVIGTGHPVPPDCGWLATAFDPPFVWHLFEEL